MRIAILFLVLASPLAAQDVKRPPASVTTDSNADAQKHLAKYEAALADKEAKVRVDAIEAIGARRSPLYIKTLAAALKDKNNAVTKAAAIALGNQPFPAAIEPLLEFACDEKANMDQHKGPLDVVRIEAIKSLADTGIGKNGYAQLREVWERLELLSKSEVFVTLGKVKEKKAFSFMVDHLDKPDFTGPKAPTVPEQKAIMEVWDASHVNVENALKELTGEKFATAKEYIDWANGAGKKLGFVYAKGK